MARGRLLLLLLAASALVVGRGDSEPSAETAETGGDPQPFSISAEDFEPGGDIPVKLTCDGADRSPRLFWTAPPEGTRELALIVEDPDAGNFVHWVAYNTPGTAREFSGGQQEGNLATFGANDFGGTGWAGPCPPEGDPHEYGFALFALDEPLGVEPGATAAELRSAMDGKIIDQARISGFYKRRAA